ncbi:MAG: hypothetical protein RL213_2092 [Bacteroidota bacterium]|jgi:DNA-binding NarL/FixJ family response regulator
MSIYTDLHIVSIDDDPNMRSMLEDFVTSKFQGARFSPYSSGEEALQGLSTKPDLIILDYHLDTADPAAMNGIQVLSKLRNRFRDAQIVFLSAQESAEVSSNTIKFGAFDYIVKNQFAFQRLEVVVRNIMGQATIRKTAGTQKFFNYLLAAICATLLAGIVMMRMNG